ncbi:MAG: hypothetical protein NTX24_04945 [Candidatus Pacearchaeota archaeon]|nr:hypothetical protein [Candidatus Pacearchaeota archaeon]
MKKPNWKIWIKNREECEFWLDLYMKKGILKKSKDESKLHLRRTDHNLNLANWLLEKHKSKTDIFSDDTFYDWVIDMYYYAIYHASLALISKQGHISKNHSATLCFLIYHNYHTKKALDEEDVALVANSLSREDIETVGMSKELREKACYDVHESFEQKLTTQIKEKTISFVNKIKGLMLY